MANIIKLISSWFYYGVLLLLLRESYSSPIIISNTTPVNTTSRRYSSSAPVLTTTRIIGGRNATQNEFPFQVALRFEGRERAFCGGSIISNHLILTSAQWLKKI